MALTKKELAKLRSQSVHGALTIPEARKLFAHIDALEGFLDRVLDDDPKGWRTRLGIES